MTMKRTPEQEIAKWAREVLGDEIDTSPRCPRYPECGGEERAHQALAEAMRKRRETAPRCLECAKYAKAVDSLLTLLDAKSCNGLKP